MLHSYSEKEREALASCKQIKALLHFRDGASLYDLRMEIQKILHQAGLSIKLLDGIVKKVLTMLKKYHILEHFQQSKSEIDQCIGCLTNTFDAMYYRLLELHKTPAKEVVESVTLFLLESILTFDQDPTTWIYGLGGHNVPGIGGKTIRLHFLSFLKQKIEHSGLPQLENAIEKVCKDLLRQSSLVEESSPYDCM